MKITGIIILPVLFLLAGCGPILGILNPDSTVIAPEETIGIAVVGDISGVLLPSTFYSHMLEAIEMAAQDHGAVHGFDIELSRFTTLGTETGGESAAQLVVANEEIMAVIGPAYSLVARGLLPVLEENAIAAISGSATGDDLPNLGISVFSRTVLSENQLATQGYVDSTYVESLSTVTTFFSDYESWSGNTPDPSTRVFLAYFYDAARILIAAIEDISHVELGHLIINPSEISATVRSTVNYSGVTGSITIGSNGNRLP